MGDSSREEMLDTIHQYLVTMASEIRQRKIQIDAFVIQKVGTGSPERPALYFPVLIVFHRI